ncbi:unnamed protein product [marine sediment metagenome]|uniref:Uncharacterized protein n=1 Tax=marine sediment metagenome TaxID=412755 RepID=X0WQV1_9ZZZZ
MSKTSYLGELKSLINLNSKKIKKDFNKELKNFVYGSKKNLKDLSPVDSKDFKNSWNSEFNDLSGTIFNEKVYAPIMELGSKPGAKPWKTPGEKTVLFEGMIYSSQAPGGIIDKAITEENINNLLESLEKSIIKVLD